MRVTSLWRSGLGLTLLAALGFATPAQQVKQGKTLDRSGTQAAKPQAAPITPNATKTALRRTHFEWNDLRTLHESLPAGIWIEEQLKALAAESETESVYAPVEDMPDVPMPKHRGGRVLPSTPEQMYGDQGGIEPLMGPCASFPSIPTAVDFASQGDGPDGFSTLFYPPNAAGSVGPNHLMTMAPNITLIQDRSGNSLAAVNTITFWSPAGAPSLVRHCRLNYDLVSGRWLASALGGPEAIGANTILLAISDTDDPTMGWDFYFWSADPDALTFADHPKLGFGANHVVVTADMFLGTANGQNRGTRVYILDKNELLTATVSGVIITGNDDWAIASGVFPGSFVNWRLQPSRADDTSEPDVWVWNSRATSGANILFQVGIIGGPGGAPTLTFPFGAGLYIPTIGYTNVRIPMTQVTEARGIDVLAPDGQQASNRARFNDSVIRNGQNFLVNCTGQPGGNAIAADRNNVNFYQVDISASPFLTPFVQDIPITTGAGTSLAFPSVAVNCANDVLIGMTSGAPTQSLTAATAMRLGTDPLNTMGAVTVLEAGVDTWWQDAPNPQGNAGVGFTLPGLGAWGHYTTTSLDPNDEKTLWTLQPYAAARVGGTDPDSRWGLQWGRFGDCEIPPVITDQPDSITPCIGDQADFTVVVSAGSYTYQWRFEGVDIPGATAATYTIPVTVLADAGTYDVIVSGCNVLSDPAVLVFGGPTINVQPVDTTAYVGDATAFTVTATAGIGTLSYQWFHNGFPVGTDSNTYSIGSVVSTDFGEYYVIVTDGCGPLQSDTVLLKPGVVSNKTKQGPSTDIVVTPARQLGCVNDSVTFGIIAAPAGSTYQWRKDGTPISPAETNSTLVLSGLTLADAGNYDVLVDTGSGVLQSHDGVLVMGDNPVITDQPNNVNASSSTPVTFSITATGVAPLTYQWKREPPTGGGYTDIPGANAPTLLIPEAGSSNAGRYRCVVTNPCGSTSSNVARLIIL